MTLSTARLAEIRARLEKATPGPWTTERPGIGKEGFTDGVIIAATAPRQGIYAQPLGGSFPEADRRFIAAAPTDIRDLLAEVERLRDVVRRALPFVEWADENGTVSRPIAKRLLGMMRSILGEQP